jgi:2-methylisocitrate lyase-like PEP mutase family enzyme
MPDRPDRRNFLKTSALVAASGLAHAEAAAAARPEEQGLSKGARFREALKQPFHAPVIESVLQARLAEAEGFPLVCVSGQAPSRALGIPDVGLVTLTDLLAIAGPIAAYVDTPVLADIEDGKGTAMHLYRGIQLFERAGMAGVLVEDADLVPHLGAPKGDLVTTAQMVDKIHAAVDARRDPNFVIVVASVGLREGRGITEVFDRAAAYEQAGADAFWFPGLPFKDNVKAAEVVKKPLMSTQGTLAELAENRVAFAAILDFGMISLGAVRRALQELKTTGAIPNATREQLTGEQLRQLDRRQEIRDLARKYHVIS